MMFLFLSRILRAVRKMPHDTPSSSSTSIKRRGGRNKSLVSTSTYSDVDGSNGTAMDEQEDTQEDVKEEQECEDCAVNTSKYRELIKYRKKVIVFLSVFILVIVTVDVVILFRWFDCSGSSGKVTSAADKPRVTCNAETEEANVFLMRSGDETYTFNVSPNDTDTESPTRDRKVNVNQTAEYRCTPGYIRESGNSVRKCSQEGTKGVLSGKSLRCRKAVVGDPCKNAEDCYHVSPTQVCPDCCQKNATCLSKKNAQECTNQTCIPACIGDKWYHHGTEKCYKLVTSQLSYDSAHKYCRDSGWMIAMPRIERENAAIVESANLRGRKAIWIGLKWNPAETKHKFSDVRTLETWNMWGEGQPGTPATGEECVRLHNNGKWEHCRCNLAHAFVCERRPLASLYRKQ